MERKHIDTDIYGKRCAVVKTIKKLTLCREDDALLSYPNNLRKLPVDTPMQHSFQKLAHSFHINYSI